MTDHTAIAKLAEHLMNYSVNSVNMEHAQVRYKDVKVWNRQYLSLRNRRVVQERMNEK